MRLRWYILACVVVWLALGALIVKAAAFPDIRLAAPDTQRVIAASTGEFLRLRTASGAYIRDVGEVRIEALKKPTVTPTRTATPTTVPPTSTPSGQEQPVAGQTCPAWVHDSYTAQAPDGEFYPTWHPVTDPTYGCVFRHEHGSNWRRVPGAHAPTYGYGGHEVGHAGYKSRALVERSDGWTILFSVHFGTAHPEVAACTRFHWVNYQFVQNGVLQADLTWMGDFGRAMRNSRDANNQEVPITPDACPNQYFEAKASSVGTRQIPTAPDPSTTVFNNESQPLMYYPWVLDVQGVKTGYQHASFLNNTKSAVAACDSVKCNGRVLTGDSGVFNFVQGTNWGYQQTGQPEYFYVDHEGTSVVSATTAGAIRQYARAGTGVIFPPLLPGYQYYPDKRHGGTHGDWLYTMLPNTGSGSEHIVNSPGPLNNPNNIVQDPN